MLRDKQIMRSIALLFTIFAASSSLDYALSQTNEGSDIDKLIAEWSTQKGVVVTKSARAELGVELENYVNANASTAGFAPREVRALAEGAKQSSIKVVANPAYIGEGQEFIVGLGGNLSIAVRTPYVRRFIDGLLGRIGSFLERFPNIHLVVVPAPPRDYIVEINDEPYPATESGLYGVAPGAVKVRVVRGTMPPCSWAGTVARGPDQEVSCNL
jgi:hypothetical protein